jgi:protein-L-isoaspartate(D-aspartate) O-methyltransferase
MYNGCNAFRASAGRTWLTLGLALGLLTASHLPLVGCGESDEAEQRATGRPVPATPPDPSAAGPALPAASVAPPPGRGPGASDVAKRWLPPSFAARRDERDRMVAAIRRHGLRDEAVLKALTAVPRHEFVPPTQSGRSYGDHPLPIGHGQTISQPYIVAEMTRQLRLEPGASVLEVGTGSGYQAAVLTHFTTSVYTIEIVKPLAETAARRLQRLGYDVVEARHGDGYLGWPEKGPFDAVIVTCAAGQIPPPLIRQLKPGGRMVIPVGGPFAHQELMLVEKDPQGEVSSRSLMAVEFVPLLRKDPSER